MSKKFGFKILSLAFALAISGTLGITSNSYGGFTEGQSPPAHITGPAITGSATITDTLDGSATVTFTGTCMNGEVSFGPLSVGVNVGNTLSSRRDLVGIIIPADVVVAAGGCGNSALDAVVNAVTSFNKQDNTILAGLVLLYQVTE